MSHLKIKNLWDTLTMTIYKIIMEQRKFVGVWKLLRPHLHMFVCQSPRVLWYIILEPAINYFILSYAKFKVYVWSHHTFPVLNTTFWDGVVVKWKVYSEDDSRWRLFALNCPEKKGGGLHFLVLQSWQPYFLTKWQWYWNIGVLSHLDKCMHHCSTTAHGCGGKYCVFVYMNECINHVLLPICMTFWYYDLVRGIM